MLMNAAEKVMTEWFEFREENDGGYSELNGSAGVAAETEGSATSGNDIDIIILDLRPGNSTESSGLDMDWEYPGGRADAPEGLGEETAFENPTMDALLLELESAALA